VVFLKRRNVMDKLYTCNEVADMFRVKVITVWDWIREGKLEALNIGSDKKPNYRVSEAHIEKFNK
jgi:transposase